MKTEAGKVDWSKLHKSPFPASSVYKTYDGWKVLEYNVIGGNRPSLCQCRKEMNEESKQ